MKKTYMRLTGMLLACMLLFGSVVNVAASFAEDPVETSAQGNAGNGSVDEDAPEESEGKTEGDTPSVDTPSQNPGAAGDEKTDAPKDPGPAKDETVPNEQPVQEPESGPSKGEGANGQEPERTEHTGPKELPGDISSTEQEDVSGQILVEKDKNDDEVEIKKNDKAYLALGENLSPEQKSTVLSLMGIDEGKLSDYNVVYVNNAEEHRYLDAYIDSGKIGSKSLSSIVIVERESGSGINISTNNISYCTVGMYKNALATAGIQDADIIVAGPFPISGTAALVGIFKAYKEMTGEEIDEECIDAALHELVVTGELEASGGDADEIEGMIAYVKQAVVKHDMSDASEIREAIEEGCEKFGLTLTEEEKGEIVGLMQKISELDLDLDKLMNAAQSIYDKIANADGGFWAKIREILQTLWQKIKELF